MRTMRCVMLGVVALGPAVSWTEEQTSIAAEAQMQAEAHLAELTWRCPSAADSAFYADRGVVNFVSTITQLKAPRVSIRSWKPKEADALNGVEWEGVVTIEAKARRLYQNGRWSEWMAGGGMNFHFDMSKKNGTWTFGSPNGLDGGILIRVACTDLPPL